MAKQQNERPKMGDMLKSLPKVETPIQEVRPVAEPAPEPPKQGKQATESNLHVWIQEDLSKRLKIEAVISNKSIKQICIEALEAHLPKRT